MTAVEWLMENSHIIPKTGLNKRELIKQAKEMEKQQIIEAYWEGCSNWDSETEAEQYYKEAFSK